MMNPSERIQKLSTACLLVAGAILAQQALAAPAARVEFAVGNPEIASAGGAARPLAKGATVEAGDTVFTNDGRVQLRFTDGAYVSLQPQSQFRVDDYRWEGRADGSERGFFSLLRGGLRTITGVVGRSNKRNYRVSTTVATIGIRGTEYKISPLDDGIVGSIGEGAIEVCTGAGCFPFASGETFQVSDPSTEPQLTDKQVDLPPPPGGFGPGSVFGENNDSTKNPGGAPLIAGDEVDPSGTIDGLRMIGVQRGMTVSDNADGLATYSSTVVFDDSGMPVQIGSSLLPPLVDVGNDGFISWGREDSVAGFGYFFVTGPATPASDIASLAISRPVGTYTLIGGTAPVGSDASGAPVVGRLTGGSLTAHFAAGKVDASLSLDMDGKALKLGANGMGIATSPTGATFTSAAAQELCTVAGGSCNMQGFFAGAGAVRAGVVYEANTLVQRNGQPTDGVTAAGAAALTLKR
jgi:hypothetical protein